MNTTKVHSILTSVILNYFVYRDNIFKTLLIKCLTLLIKIICHKQSLLFILTKVPIKIISNRFSTLTFSQSCTFANCWHHMQLNTMKLFPHEEFRIQNSVQSRTQNRNFQMVKYLLFVTLKSVNVQCSTANWPSLCCSKMLTILYHCNVGVFLHTLFNEGSVLSGETFFQLNFLF